MVRLPGGEEQQLYFAEGRCEGTVSGAFRGTNHPRRRTDGTYCADMQGFIETDDGGLILFDYQGYGRVYPAGRRQVVGAAWHTSNHPEFAHLNDAICVVAGEVRSPNLPPEEFRQADVELVLDVAELVWEPPADEEDRLPSSPPQ